MPRYMLMLLDNPSDYAGLSPEQMQGVVKEYNAWAGKMGKEGKLAGGEKLADEGGKVLTRGGSGLVLTDGPFAESKEVLGGYFILKAGSYDEAVEIARTCPHAKYGVATHIRQIDEAH